MTTINDLFYWDFSNNIVLFVNLVIAIGLFTSLRLFSGTVSHINASDELIKKNNPAFGISLAGMAFAITIILSGTIYGDPLQTVQDSAIAIGIYGVVGILLMALTRLIFDKIAFPNISIRDEIINGNIAAGIIDAGNVVATALIIRAVMVWIPTNTLEGIIALCIGYVISQLILTIVTFIHIQLFHFKYKHHSLQQIFKDGNTALALRFTGFRVGMAFAITAASQLMIYELNDVLDLLLGWSLVSVVTIIVLSMLAFIADRVILFRINTVGEVIAEKNIALGALQGVIYISLGLLLSELIV